MKLSFGLIPILGPSIWLDYDEIKRRFILKFRINRNRPNTMSDIGTEISYPGGSGLTPIKGVL